MLRSTFVELMAAKRASLPIFVVSLQQPSTPAVHVMLSTLQVRCDLLDVMGAVGKQRPAC